MNLIWKEWRQQRLLFLVGCLLALIGPLADVARWLSAGQMGVSKTGSFIVMIFGAAYALILAAATTQDDVRHGISDFWQSRPVSIARLFTTKMVVGAGLLLVGFLLIQGLDLSARVFSASTYAFTDEAWTILTVTWPAAVLLFAVTMFLTALMRDPARSVLGAVWFGLLLYFLPVLTSGLKWLNIFDIIGGRRSNQHSLLFDVFVPILSNRGGSDSVLASLAHLRFWRFVGAFLVSPGYMPYLMFVVITLTAAALLLVLTVIAVRRNWRWTPGDKTLAWTIGLSLVLIFGLVMFQVGHNLEPATTYGGKPIDPVMRLNIHVDTTYDWASPPGDMVIAGMNRYMFGRRICTSGKYLYAVDSASENPNMPVQAFDGLLDICQFPAATGKATILSRTRFAVTPPLSRNMHSGLTICTLLLRENFLFVGYQVCIATGQPADDATATRGASRAGHTGVRPPDTYSLRMLVVDVSDSAAPKRIVDEEIERSQTPIFQKRGQSSYGEFCYIWQQKELFVVSLADVEHPKVVRKMSIADFGLDPDRPELVEQLDVVGDKLLCVGQRVILLLDLADPQLPRLVFRRVDQPMNRDDSGIIYAGLYADELLYLSRVSGVEIHRLSRTPAGEYRDELLGVRPMTPLERLAGRRPHELMLRQGYLYEADDRFGMLVYDVSDPSRPRRAYHASGDDYITAIGTWEGLLYMSGPLGTLTLVAMP